MTITTPQKQQIQAAIMADFESRSAATSGYVQSRHANYLGINTSVYSRMKSGETDRLLSDGEWVRLALKLNVQLLELSWKVAKTATFRTITGQLQVCMNNAVGGIFCDDSNLGKTFAGKEFARHYANVAFVDCSGVKTWSKLIRAIARAFGFNTNGSLTEIRQGVIDGVLALEHPLIILDEAGDLSDSAILELKGLWNSLEYLCGWYMMGANGLRVKMERKMNWNKVGYEELFNRLGSRFQNMTATMTEGQTMIFKRKQIELMTKTQRPDLPPEQVAEIVNACQGNARRLRIELMKLSAVI